MRAIPLLLVLLPLLLPGAPLPAAGAPQPPPEPDWSSDDTDALLALARRYAEQESDADKDRVLAEARELGPFDRRDGKRLAKELMEVARSGPKSEGKGTCFASYEPFPGKYYLSGAGGGKKGIFVGLHGGEGGVGDGKTAQSLWGGATGKGLIGLFPTANLPDHAATTWKNREVEGFVLAAIKELKRTFRIDTNRIYCAGHSLGGSGTWSIGLRHADLFAAVSPNAGGLDGSKDRFGKVHLPGGYLANLYNTPIFFTHYDQDPRVFAYDAQAAAKELAELREQHPGGYEHVWVEGKGKSHGFPPDGRPSKIIAWMTRRERDPYPEKVIWEPSIPHKRMFFWLRRDRVWRSRGRGTRITASIEKNVVEVTVNRAKGLSILLADEMFDADDPVVVKVNGKETFRDYVQRDPAAILESIMENIDPEQVWTYRIDL